MSVWDDFHARHGRKNFTPVFNEYLERLIADDSAELDSRLRALILRSSWGNHSDCCVNAEGLAMPQAGLARELGVERWAVNKLMSAYVRAGYVRLQGREIHPVDDPFEGESTFANSSPNGEPFSTNSEDKANKPGPEPEPPGLEDFIADIWAAEDPIGYQAYQDVAKSYKAWRIKLLAKYKAWKQTSEKVRQSGEEKCRKGSDDASERVRQTRGKGPTNGSVSINENGKQKTYTSSSSVLEALSTYGKTDDDAEKDLVEACRANSPDATDDEIAHFVREKAKLLTPKIQNRIGFLLTAVPKCFAGKSFRAWREQRVLQKQAVAEGAARETAADEQRRREYEATLNDPNATEFEKELARNVLGTLRKPAESEPGAKAQKAGQG